MGTIRLLDTHVANLIAAGEVVERPAAVVKELVENSIDAGAKEVLVETVDGGKTRLRVRDDGDGIPQDQVALAFERHATSKITTADDLDHIITCGFRGEALASIASVARVEIITRTENQDAGIRHVIEGGRTIVSEPVSCPRGCDIRIDDLFYNTPGRRKFMKTTATEQKHITNIALKLALANTDVRMSLVADGREVFSAPVFRDPLERLAALMGPNVAKELVPVAKESPVMSVHGYIGTRESFRRNKEYLHCFVNQRPVRDRTLEGALRAGYGPLWKEGSFPVVVLFVDLDPTEVDVNVHPQKQEVRFKNSGAVYGFLRSAVVEAFNAIGTLSGDAVKTGDSGLKTESILRSEERIDPQPPPRNESIIGADAELPWEHERAPRPAPPASWPTPQQPSTTPGPASSPASPRPAAPAASSGQGQQPQAERESLSGLAASDLAARDLASYAGHKPRSRWRVLGQFNDTFILVQDGQDLLLIDQHVVQERIHFEAQQNYLQQGGLPVQRLLFPESIHFQDAQARAGYVEHRETLEQLGFQLEPGAESDLIYVLQTMPAFAEGVDPKILVWEVLQDLMGEGETTVEKLLADLIATVACKASIKANTALTMAEMEHLVDQLFTCREPMYCPHGRPIVVRLSEGAVRGAFGRS